jgi:S-adenosylmethionine-diacylglycerol 3-amino-3-carboxypropyl transferase
MTNHYFTELNYSLANEDNYLEYEIVKQLRPQRICAVCGSGGRSLPLVTPDTNEIDLCDLSSDQLHFAALKESSYRKLNYETFLSFWGYPKHEISGKKRRELYLELLNHEKRSLLRPIFELNNWDEPIYYGKWEKTFIFFSTIIRKILGKEADYIFNFNKIEDQRRYIQKDFPMWKWKIIIGILGQKSTMDALLYKGDFIKKNIKQNFFKFYLERFNRSFNAGLARENFFLQILLQGKLTQLEAIPVEADKQVFETLNQSKFKANYHQESIFDFMSKKNNIYDFVSLSDVPSYLSGDIEKDFLNIIYPSLKVGCVVVIRYYLRICDVDSSKYEDVTSTYSQLIEREKIKVYDIKIFKKVK